MNVLKFRVLGLLYLLWRKSRFSTEGKITSKVTLGNGVSIGANSVVNKDCGDNVLLVGMPAVVKRPRKIWYEEENSIHLDRVRRIEYKNDRR